MKRGWCARATAGIAVFIAITVFSGCFDPLFPENAQRHPYERYSSLRGNEAQVESEDTFGRPQANLRERLAPLESR
ncbi:MAG: hypothetical protein AAFY08_06835 [Planctomycetota bacterium]